MNKKILEAFEDDLRKWNALMIEDIVDSGSLLWGLRALLDSRLTEIKEKMRDASLHMKQTSFKGKQALCKILWAPPKMVLRPGCEQEARVLSGQLPDDANPFETRQVTVFKWTPDWDRKLTPKQKEQVLALLDSQTPPAQVHFLKGYAPHAS